MQRKVCNHCKQEKEISEFAIRVTNRHTGAVVRRCECRECYNAYFRAYFKDKEKLAKQTARVKTRKTRISFNTRQYKIDIGCQLCGYNKCAASIDFHHLNKNNKCASVSRIKNFSCKTVNEEIKKCVLLCKNCHHEVEDGITTLPTNISELPDIDTYRKRIPSKY